MTTNVTNNPISSFASNVKTNFQNMSTLKKVALGLTTLALVGASVAAFVSTPALIAFSATTLGFGVSALAVQLTGAGLGTLGLAIPAFALIGAPKKNNEESIEMAASPAQEEPIGPAGDEIGATPAEETQVTQTQEQSAFSLSRFAYNHRYLLVGAVLVTAAVIGGTAYLGKDGMKAQGQNLVAAGQKLSGQAFNAGKNALAKLSPFKK